LDVPLGYPAAAILNYQINISKVSSVLCQICNLNVRPTIQFNSLFLLLTSVWLLLHLITLSDTHTLGRTPLDELSVRRKDFYLTTHNTRKRQTTMPPGGFKPTNPAGERPQTHDLDGATTAFDRFNFKIHIKFSHY